MSANSKHIAKNIADTLRTVAKLDREWMTNPAGREKPDSLPWMPFSVPEFISLLAEALPEASGDVFFEVGCVDADSEYLSPTGWCRIVDYDGGPVMQYDPDTGEGALVQPERYIVKSCDEFYDLHTKYGINQRLSAEHRVLFWKITGAERRRVPTVWTAEKFAAEHGRLALGVSGEFQTTFIPQISTKVELSDEQIRVQVMVNADGYLRRPENAVLKFRKPRKIERARELLAAAGISYHESLDNTRTVRFSFIPPWSTKSYEGFWPASTEQLRVISEECLHWDGSVTESRAGRFSTRIRESADFIQYAMTASGYRAVLREDRRGDATDYTVFANTNTMVGMAGRPKTDILKVPSEDGKAYCFTVPTGFWVMRRGGNVVMTGNCGIGTKMLLAQEIFGLEVAGIERVPEYLDQARKLGLDGVRRRDALSYEGYGDQDIIFLNLTFHDRELQAQLERKVQEDMKRGAVLIGVNLLARPPDSWWVVLDDVDVIRGIWQKP